MIRYHSVFFKLHAFFFLALVVLALLSISAYHEQQTQQYRLLTHRSMELSQILSKLTYHTCHQQNEELSSAGFEPKESLSSDAHRLSLPPAMQRKLTFNQLHVEIYEENGEIIYALLRNHCTMFYRDTVERNSYYFVWGVFFVLFGGLLSMYLLLWRNLRPLNHLYRQIERYRAGEKNIPPKNNGKDEIALISNALYSAFEQEERLQKSRELFLRNMMHELKTPITKGKLIVELEKLSPNIVLLSKLFNRMEHLIQQMAQIEKMHAFALTKAPILLDTMLHTAIEHLLIDPRNVQITGGTYTIAVDQNLFTSALQNLIDNAYRHATSYPIFIECDGEKVCIINSAEPLKRPVEEALQAFVTERGEGGLGLGLYIAQSVCDLHRFKLSYTYKQGRHHFCIVFDER